MLKIKKKGAKKHDFFPPHLQARMKKYNQPHNARDCPLCNELHLANFRPLRNPRCVVLDLTQIRLLVHMADVKQNRQAATELAWIFHTYAFCLQDDLYGLCIDFLQILTINSKPVLDQMNYWSKENLHKLYRPLR